MTPTVQDLINLAQYCAGFEPKERAKKCRLALRCVYDAACFVEITGKAHPFYGDGSMSSLLLRHRAIKMPDCLDSNVLSAVGIAVQGLLEARQGTP